jgi:DNA-binding Lrp family transcriptional regulator
MTNENINSVYRIYNVFDYLVEAIFKDMADLQRFNDLLEKFRIDARQELFILEDLKRESFLSEEIHAKLLS